MAAAPMLHVISVIVFAICSCATTIHAYPSGAPSGACTALYPSHSAASQGLASSPLELNISQFSADGGYVPGKTYKSKSCTCARQFTLGYIFNGSLRFSVNLCMQLRSGFGWLTTVQRCSDTGKERVDSSW